MKRNHFLQLITVCFFWLMFSVAHAAPIDKVVAENWVRDKGNLLLNTFNEKDLAAKYQKLDSLFIKYVDLNYVGKFVLGKYWKLLNEKQQKEYLTLFHRYALSLYKGFPLSFDNRLSFKVGKVDSRENYTDVWTSINLAPAQKDGVDTTISVAFRLHKENDEIKIIDITLGESSLILSYRSRFYQMMEDADSDPSWFLEDLQTVTKSNEKNNQQQLQNSELSQKLASLPVQL